MKTHKRDSQMTDLELIVIVIALHHFYYITEHGTPP